MAEIDTNDRTIFTKIALGFKVQKTGGAVDADDDLFTVYGLNSINLLYGKLTTAQSGGAGTIALNEQADSIAIVAATTITGFAINTLLLAGGQPDIGFNGAGTPTVAVATMTAEHDSLTDRSASHTPIIINGGSAGVVIESTETGDRAGEITWTIFYHPLEIGAFIEAAA